jgi:hypothetical protein
VREAALTRLIRSRNKGWRSRRHLVTAMTVAARGPSLFWFPIPASTLPEVLLNMNELVLPRNRQFWLGLSLTMALGLARIVGS